jgi:hypothetical protein
VVLSLKSGTASTLTDFFAKQLLFFELPKPLLKMVERFQSLMKLIREQVKLQVLQ